MQNVVFYTQNRAIEIVVGSSVVLSLVLGYISLPNTSTIEQTNFSCRMTIGAAIKMTFTRIVVNVDLVSSSKVHVAKQEVNGKGLKCQKYLYI